MPLTNTTIRHVKAGSKTVKLFDELGLYLQISPKGGKWWRFKYRFQGKEKLLSLGVYPDVSLKQAREQRHAMRQLLANGIDPSAHRQLLKARHRQSAANSVEHIAREWFAKYAPRWSEHYADRLWRSLERDIFPWLGTIDIAALTAPQILSALRRIEKHAGPWKQHTACWAIAGK